MLVVAVAIPVATRVSATANLQVNGKLRSSVMVAIFYLGLYETPEQAHKAYVKLGKELHGEFFNAG